MSPEYAMDGTFSVKSDTYSFGVILLEIISGLKITLAHFTGFPNLLAYVSMVAFLKFYKYNKNFQVFMELISLVQAWSLWQDGKAIDLLDSLLAETCSPAEALRCIHIGLLCVQDNPDSRPLMSSVVLMLENEFTPLSVPKQPVYFPHRYSEAQGSGENTSSSVNNMSVTVLDGR
jgi:serine/threonine protein kinase